MGDGHDLRVILGHGASGTAASMRPWVDGLMARGFGAQAIDLPKGTAERAMPVFAEAIEGAMVGGRAGVVPGGHSFGGRVASLVAARRLGDGAGDGAGDGPGIAAETAPTGPGIAADTARAGSSIAGLLLLSYPLHRPGDPGSWFDRTDHWPLLRCPVLLLSGESDPFARLELLREAATRLPDARLITYPRVGHGLAPVLDDALDRAAEFLWTISSPQ